ncbi:EVE domain-containing protein [Porticoccus sp.]|uniref:EVE domain-containing protein n=1 Tax=Porticoccus sp. TaxID=2024853 RepID=UPI003F69DA17
MSYWLFKSEPDVYGIDDLAAEPGQQCRWGGIRNYQARNHLRDRVKPGDQALFYHSSCKAVGIAGIMDVTSAGYPDPDQFDAASDGYDPVSTVNKPRWFCVDVKLVRKFVQLIPLSELKQQRALEDMVLFRQGRLSIVPVTDEEWQTIVSPAG